MSTKIKANEIEWRRSKVIEMRASGMSQAEIARELRVSEASISLDMQYVREQAKKYIKQMCYSINIKISEHKIRIDNS